jgi:hypothetical protein
MARPLITEDDERWAHRYLRLSVPFEALSAPVRKAVAATAAALAPRLRRRMATARMDFKRRAAGDLDD